jgi:hypothetical protein
MRSKSGGRSYATTQSYRQHRWRVTAMAWRADLPGRYPSESGWHGGSTQGSRYSSAPSWAILSPTVGIPSILAPAVLLRYADRADRQGQGTPRRHPVPNLLQMVLEVPLNVCPRRGVHSRRALLGLDVLRCPPHRGLGHHQRLDCVHRRLPWRVDLCRQLSDPGPSLPRHDSGVLAPTPWSVPAPRHGTQSLVGRPLASRPAHRGARFPRATQKPMSRSRRLHAGHHRARQQVPREAYPRFTTPPWFRGRPDAVDTCSAVHWGSSP